MKRFSTILGAIVIIGFIASFFVHFPIWAHVVLLALAGVEIYFALKK